MGWFGPSKEDAWRQLCHEIGSEFIEGGFVRGLFADAGVRSLMLAQRQVHLSVKDGEGRFGPSLLDDVDELRFQVLGVIKEVDGLKALFDLFAEILHRLCRIGSAYEDDPGVAL
jgi:hypothetical protein